MGTKTIPARTETTCDACGVVCDNGGFGVGARRMQGMIRVQYDALDMLGDPAADGSASYELCDECLRAVSHSIKLCVESRRDNTKPGGD